MSRENKTHTWSLGLKTFIGHWSLPAGRSLGVGWSIGVLAALFFFLPLSAHAANRYWVGSAGGNTSDTANPAQMFASLALCGASWSTI